MLLTPYKNENGDIDKVVLVSEGPEDSQALLDCYDHYKPKSSDALLYSAGFAGEGQDPSLIDGDAERAKLEAISLEYAEQTQTQ